MIKTYFQNIHYNKKKPCTLLSALLSIGEFFYGSTIKIKNYLYKKGILKEIKVDPYVICVGNLTTGGVGKTPITISLANNLADKNKVAVISRGYGAKINTKKPVVIKDEKGIKFANGTMCADEPFQIAKKVKDNVIVIICSSRIAAVNYAKEKYRIDTVILDDGFSNRTIKKDKTIVAIDSKMRFGNNHLLPKGPLREPLKELERANEVIIVDKGDPNLTEAIEWYKNNFNKPCKISKMRPKRIYNIQTKADVIKTQSAIAFCAIGQPEQFFDFAKKYYEIKEQVVFSDHYKYKKSDIKNLISIAQKHNVNTFITTQKDETKLIDLVQNTKDYCFNILELENTIVD